MLIQLFMFYVFPLFAGPTDAMGMVVLIILATLFVPSVFIYYNETALIHSVWYLVVASVGLTIGAVLHKMIFRKM